MKAIDAIYQRPPTKEQLRQLQLDYRQAINPIVRILADIESTTYNAILYPDGHTERVYTQESKMLREKALSMLDEIKSQFFRRLAPDGTIGIAGIGSSI